MLKLLIPAMRQVLQAAGDSGAKALLATLEGRAGDETRTTG